MSKMMDITVDEFKKTLVDAIVAAYFDITLRNMEAWAKISKEPDKSKVI